MENTERFDFDVSKIRVTGRRVLVRMCFNPDITDEHGKVLIALPEKTKNYTHWAELIGVGPKCEWFKPEHVGMLIHVDEGGDGYHWLGDGPDTEGYWFIEEQKLQPVVYE